VHIYEMKSQFLNLLFKLANYISQTMSSNCAFIPQLQELFYYILGVQACTLLEKKGSLGFYMKHRVLYSTPKELLC